MRKKSKKRKEKKKRKRKEKKIFVRNIFSQFIIKHRINK